MKLSLVALKIRYLIIESNVITIHDYVSLPKYMYKIKINLFKYSMSTYLSLSKP